MTQEEMSIAEKKPEVITVFTLFGPFYQANPDQAVLKICLLARIGTDFVDL
jgi:lactate dehydrogenase-like 2-hydroxyacid dehydrogenase